MTELHVNGMTCGNCARKVTTTLQGVPGVATVMVDVGTARASVRWSASPDVPAALAALQRAGYPASLLEPTAAVPVRNWHLNLWLGILVTVTLMVGEWGFGLMMEPWFQWLSFALAAVVQMYCGAEFYRGAWRQLKTGSSNMDTLVALGSTTAFAFSAWVLLTGRGGHVYFMEAASIITLVSIGHWLEARVGQQAGKALKSLMQLAPAKARKLRPVEPKQAGTSGAFDFRKLSFSDTAPRIPDSASESEVEVEVAALRGGDLVVLRPGERVPVDGVVTTGESAVDEAMLTGESVPVDKRPGSELFAGTMNLNGRLVMRVTATGEATALANIIAAVQRAQSSRADIQRLGDRVSNVFVPIVVAIALAAGLGWGFHVSAERGFMIAAAVLIVACPCAMGLATPAAIMAAANAAARRGILIRDGVALEKAGKITAIAFDKTGTLTEGKPKLVEKKLFSFDLPRDLSPAQMDELAAALADLSNHPLSQAIAETNPARPSLGGFKELAGKGISALYPAEAPGAHFLQLGSLRWLEAEGVDCKVVQAFADAWMQKGATVIGLAVDVRLVSVYALRDTLKPGAKELIQRLGNSHMPDDWEIHLLSGDTIPTVKAIAEELGIYDCTTHGVHAEMTPQKKAEFIKQLQAQGQRVAFVGDGINDAPALTQADLGIAVGKASDVAREAADIILLRSDIEAVPEALGLARAALATIKQNLFWAFFYNAVGVPLAALGFMSPILCAAAMGFSDLIVIGNALRLARWKNPRR